MGEAYFYHLTHSSVEKALQLLLEKARGAGWRVLVRGAEEPRLMRLDDLLWQGAPESFMAHGLWSGPDPAAQPILLAPQSAQAHNGAQCLMSIDGADISAAEVQAAARVCIIFDGNLPSAVDAARVQWKSLTDQSVAAQYWSEETGRWAMKAKSG